MTKTKGKVKNKERKKEIAKDKMTHSELYPQKI